MKFALAFALLISVPALAHVEEGRYVGHTADGAACEMISQGMSFEKGMHHPLTERVTAVVNGVTFVAGHPAVIDAATATASFNHDMFQGVVAIATGAQALQIDMVHTPEKEGPSGFTFIENNWKTGVKTSIACKDIELVP
jgi:hypothetical protein